MKILVKEYKEVRNGKKMIVRKYKKTSVGDEYEARKAKLEGRAWSVMKDFTDRTKEIGVIVEWLKDHMKQVQTNTLWHERFFESYRNMKICLRRISVFKNKKEFNQQLYEEIRDDIESKLEIFTRHKNRFIDIYG